MGRPKSTFWELDGDIRRFPSLSGIKQVINCEYLPNERMEFLNGCEIYRIDHDRLIETYVIHIDKDGNLESIDKKEE